MSYLGYVWFIALAVVLCLPPVAVAQEGAPSHPVTVRPASTAPTPRTPDGHPDLTGIWNGMGGNLNGVSNQLHNQGIAVESDTSTHDVHSGAKIVTWSVPKRKPQDIVEAGHSATLLHRLSSNLPIYKPEYWEKVNELDLNSNEDDPSNNCIPFGVPRMGIPTYIGQFPTHLIFVYAGLGGGYRMIPVDGRKHTPLDDLDPSYNGEAIGHWEGDTLVVDTWGFTSDTWFDQLEDGGGGYFHSEDMHVIERFHRDGNNLTWTATVDDPDVLLEPWTTTPRVETLNPDPKAVLPDTLPCSERAFSHAVSKERH
jgi:hypothetical protein